MAKAYERISEDLREQIRNGDLEPGERLPAETALVERYRRSLPTVRQALGTLQAEGLIEKQHGRGNIVRKPRRLVERRNDRHQWEKDRAQEPESERRKTGTTEQDTGLDLPDLEFSAEYRDATADEELASMFGTAVGTPLVERIYRTRYREEDAPFNLVHSYLPRSVIESNPALLDHTNEPWPGGTQNQLFTVGIELDRIVEHVTARPPTVEEADELGLSAGVSVLVLRKVCIDITGRTVEASEVTLPGDRTELVFTTPLTRW